MNLVGECLWVLLNSVEAEKYNKEFNREFYLSGLERQM